MGDTFWMEDEVRVEWDKTEPDYGRIFEELDRPAAVNKLFFMQTQTREFIFPKEQLPATDTGSQYLNPGWRHNIVKISSAPTKLQALISLN